MSVGGGEGESECAGAGREKKRDSEFKKTQNFGNQTPKERSASEAATGTLVSNSTTVALSEEQSNKAGNVKPDFVHACGPDMW